MIRRISHALFRLAAALLAVAIIAVAALGARLASGPIQLTRLAPYIERAFAPADQQVRVEVRDAQLRLGNNQVVELVGIDVRAERPDGEVLIGLPEIEVGISLRALLLRGILAPTALQVTAPSLVLARGEDGAIGLGGLAASAREASRGQIDVDRLLAALFSVDPGRPLSYLDRLEISGGQLLLQDRLTNHTVMARDAQLRVARRPDGLAADLAFALEQIGEPARVRTTGRLDQSTGRISFALAFERLSAAELVRIEPLLPLEGADLMLDGELDGEVDLRGELSPLTFELRASDGVIARPDLLAGPLPVEALSIAGEVAADLASVTVSEARLASNGAVLDATAEIAWRDRQMTLNAEVTAENVAADDLELFWPPALGRAARAWVVANIVAGVVPRAVARIAFRPGDLDQHPIPEETVAGRFEFDDLTLRYFETMPPLTGIGGTATFTARRMDFAVARGHLDDLVIEDGNVTITGIGIKGRHTTQLEVVANVAGPIAQAMALIDHPPFGFAGDLGIAPASTSGRTRTTLRLGTPLNRDMDPADVRLAASAELSDAGIRGLRDVFDISDGRFTLTVDREGADLAGAAAVNQVPLAITWRENFAEDAQLRRRFHLQGTLDAQALRQLGLELPVAAWGSSDLDATVLESAAGREAEIALDLAALAIEAPALSWRKPAGEPGQLTASLLLPDEGPIRVQTFALAAAGLDAAGSLELSADPVQVERLVLDRLRTGHSEAALHLRRRAEDGYAIDVRARTVDLDAILEARAQVEDAHAEDVEVDLAPATPLSLSLVAEQVFFGGHRLSAVEADLVRDARGWRAADLQARLPGGGSVALTLASDGGPQQLRITSDDAGDLLQTLDRATRIEGGQLELTAEIAQQVPALAAAGTLRIDQFTVLDAPLLARLLTVASLTGIGNLLGGEGIHFDRLELPLTLRDDLLSIERGRMSGSQLGLTAKGQVDLARDRFDLQGTVVPLYGLNRAIGKIPLVGPFLSGQEGEGAFAATYSVKGPLDAPQISVNPLAVLAPGFIRDLFSGIASGSLEPPVVPNPDD